MTVKRASFKRKKPTRAKSVKGIVAAAQALGVTRQHLVAVLKGRRISGRLLARYCAWQGEQTKNPKTENETHSS